ncbi:hypothetical protein GYA49_05560 [Candidatus Beckwithbacteria bacterium]|nr:hypothetical protein [Candidatus Beckwithbacteria bacterium]
MLKKIITLGSFFILLFTFFAQKALAVSAPDFPSCASPRGEIIANYSDGLHGIVGVITDNHGSDQVYQVSSDLLIQCFCPEGGNGTQTNWWQIGDLSQDDINAFRKQGWYYVPNGEVWGLSQAPYLAQNQYYDCGSGPKPTPTSTPNPDGGKHSSMGKNGPTCEDSAIEVTYDARENGNKVEGVKVTFIYRGMRQIAHTNKDGRASVSYSHSGEGSIEAEAEDNFPNQAVYIDTLICDSGIGGGSILGTSSSWYDNSTGIGGAILGLADTGTTDEIAMLLGLAGLSFAGSWVLHKKSVR